MWNSHLGQTVVGGAAAAAGAPGARDAPTQHEECAHVALALDLDDPALFDHVAALSQDQGGLLGGLKGRSI